MQNNISFFTKGWLVGDFTPAIINSKDIEVGVKEYKAGTVEENHVHKITSEYTVVLFGVISMLGEEYQKGDIVFVPANTPNQFVSITDSMVLVIKTPSIPNDKYIL